MINIDGYAKVITDNDGKILMVETYFTEIEEMDECINFCELESFISEVNSKDSLVLLLLKYSKFDDEKEGRLEEQISKLGEFILKGNYKKHLEDNIEELFAYYEAKKEHTTEKFKIIYPPYIAYVTAVKEYEEMYDLKYALKS